MWRLLAFGVLAACAIVFQESEGVAQAHKTPGSETVAFGQAQRFSRHLKRPELSHQQPIERFSLTISKLFSSDGRLVKIEDLAIQYAIVDLEKFKSTFGADNHADNLASSSSRLGTVVTSELAVTIGAMASGRLHEFDPMSMFRPGRTQVAKLLRNWGIVIVEIVDEKSTYRISNGER